MDDRDKPIHGKWQVLDRVLSRGADDVSEAEADHEKRDRKSEYEAINRALNDLRIGKYSYFLNYGYAPNDNPSFAAVSLPEGQIDTHSRRLVLEVIGDCSVNGLDILDVSCGRGAVSVVLQTHFEPRSYLGIDLSAEAVAFCREHHRVETHAFREGDAESLPLDDGSFDVLVNVEASHNYPHIGRFFDETARVLRPEGWFLYTDFLPPEAFEQNRCMLDEHGFDLTRDQDITSNVLLACDTIGAMRTKAHKDPDVQRFMNDFLAAPGSDTYRAMSDGSLAYRLYAFRKR